MPVLLADAHADARPARQTGLHGIVICLMPLEHEASAQRRGWMEGIFAGQDHLLLCGDSGCTDQPERRAAAVQAVDRLIAEVDEDPQLRPLPLALFGVGPGAGPALDAAAGRRGRLQALAACGGRLQEAVQALPSLCVPTLLVAGGADDDLGAIDRTALRRLPWAWRLEIVPGARSCFAEPGCFETAVHHAASWFSLHLGRH